MPLTKPVWSFHTECFTNQAAEHVANFLRRDGWEVKIRTDNRGHKKVMKRKHDNQQ